MLLPSSMMLVSGQDREQSTYREEKAQMRDDGVCVGIDAASLR